MYGWSDWRLSLVNGEKSGGNFDYLVFLSFHVIHHYPHNLAVALNPRQRKIFKQKSVQFFGRFFPWAPFFLFLQRNVGGKGYVNKPCAVDNGEETLMVLQFRMISYPYFISQAYLKCWWLWGRIRMLPRYGGAHVNECKPCLRFR